MPSPRPSVPPLPAEPWRQTLRRFHPGWRVLDEGLAGGDPVPGMNVARDGVLARAFEEGGGEGAGAGGGGAGGDGAGDGGERSGKAPAREDRGTDEPAPGSAAPTDRPLYRIWTSGQALVATRRETRLPHFQGASEAAAARGWPLVVRDSGGTLVPHLPGCLHLSLFLPRFPPLREERGEESGEERGGESGEAVAEPSSEEVYALLCEPVREALQGLGVEAGYGEVPRSFCDGRHNLVVGGRKIAGTSQRWRGGIPGHPVRGGYTLAHMTLFVEGDLAAATQEVNRFLREAGGAESFDPERVVTVESLMEPRDPRPLARVHGALVEVLARG